MERDEAPPRGTTLVIQHLANSYCIADSFKATRKEYARFGTVRLDPDSLVARLARAERSLPRGRATIGAYEVWFLEREPETFRGYGGDEQFLDGLGDLLGGGIPTFLGLAGSHHPSFGIILNLLNIGGGRGPGGDGPWGRDLWGPGGGPLGGGLGNAGSPAHWMEWLVAGLSGFLGGVGARTGFVGHGWDHYSGTTPNKYGGYTVYEGIGTPSSSIHHITVYDANLTRRESYHWGTDSFGNDFERHEKWNEHGKKTYAHYEKTTAEEKELAEAAWNWFGGDSDDSDSESMTVEGYTPRRNRIPPDVEQVRVAWEAASTSSSDDTDIDHLPIDPASGERTAPEAYGVGFVVVGQTVDGDDEPSRDGLESPGAGLGVPLRQKDHEPSIWYQIHVVDPPDLELAVSRAQRAARR